MFSLPNWFKAAMRKPILSSSAFGESPSCRSRRSARPGYLPTLEGLEERTVPSTLTVTSPLDDGSSSTLRAVIGSATAGDTIKFTNKLAGDTITLTQGQLTITKNLDIEGLGAKKLTISGNGISRIFDISGGPTVTMAGMTIAGGQAANGGGIFNETGSTLTVNACALVNNVALGSSVPVPLNPSLAVGGLGGAIENFQSTLTVTDCTFSGNQAISFIALGGAVDDQQGQVTIRGSTFTGNQALGSGPGASSGGGALDIFGPSAATMAITGSTFAGNLSQGGAGGDGINSFGFGEGGGISVINVQGAVTITDSTLTDNRAIGGALAPGALTGNGTACAGGGIAVVGALTLTIANSNLIGNQVIADAGASGVAGSIATGGGIDVVSVTTATITNCSFSDNSAVGGAGGSGAPGGAGAGGGIDVAFGSTATITGSTLTDNQAVGGAGGSGANGGAGLGGGISVGSGVLFASPDVSAVNLGGSRLRDNLAGGGDGGPGGSGGDGWGGGLAALAGTVTVSISTLDHNKAVGGGGQDGGNGGNGFGGGVYVASGASVGLTRSTVTHNRAEGGDGDDDGIDGQGIGGGLYMDTLATVSLDAFTLAHLKHNTASTSNNDDFGPYIILP